MAIATLKTIMMSNEESKYIEELNPVDYFNFYCIDEVFKTLLKIKIAQQISPTSIALVENAGDEKVVAIELVNDMFHIRKENNLELIVGKKYSPFMIVEKIMFKGSFEKTVNYIKMEHLKQEFPFMRVGTKYYKQTTSVDRYGIKRSSLVLWDKPTILDDYDKKVLKFIEKYDDFTIEPDNKHFSQVIDNTYNLYAPFEHSPAEEKDFDELGFYWINTLVEHIFGEQYELGIKYLKVLYDHPKQPLPILVLTSEERSTGKTTFVDFLNILFGANMVLINPEDIKTQFNEPYANKNVIAIEESRFESVQATEKLKNLSTQKEILVNGKNIRQFSIPFYGKLIITSNDETRFSKVDTSEIRYWVRKVPTLKGKANHQILSVMKDEIPQFLAYINSLPDVDLTKSRMVFTEEEIATKHLKTVKEESRSNLLKDLELYLDQFCVENQDIEYIYFTALNVKERFFANSHRYDLSYINSTLKNEMKLERQKIQRFVPFETSNEAYPKRIVGTPFKIKNVYYGDKQESENAPNGIFEETGRSEGESGIETANY
jgi:hypothetical protein